VVSSPAAFPLDPSLPLYEGSHYPPHLPGVFADAAPNRWGRLLLERREALAARREKRSRHRLDEWDFLVGVSDRTRMGALRLAQPGGIFVGDESPDVPPSARLRELEHWAREFEEGRPADLAEEEAWIAMLIAPGSSLGGARPKANFQDEDGRIWIAKFPSREDRHDVGGWEQVVCLLAARAGIAVPETKALRLGSSYATFCSKRFDRLEQGGRRLYASAMTLTGRRDNEEAGYLDIVQAIVNFGDPRTIEEDLEQLFRRVVFNVLSANRDDHLRNHGFLRAKGGWRLAPAFDMNPSLHRTEHSLALDDSLRLPDLDVVRETAPFYRLSPERAAGVVEEVDGAVSAWPRVASEVGLPSEEVDLLAASFRSA
jgi:serine/threonine-protein kinase HipA